VVNVPVATKSDSSNDVTVAAMSDCARTCPTSNMTYASPCVATMSTKYNITEVSKGVDNSDSHMSVKPEFGEML
jgi:hypothetical protein